MSDALNPPATESSARSAGLPASELDKTGSPHPTTLPMASSILVADDDEASRQSLVDVLGDAGYTVTAAADGIEARDALRDADFDLVLTDLRMPGIDGLEVLAEVRRLCPQTLVIIITAHASIESAVEALRQGAHDYMLKPLVYDDVITKVTRLLEQKRLAWELQDLRRQVDARYDFDNLVGESNAMKQIGERIQRVAVTTSTVLISGESGVGKEVVARAIHKQSPRSGAIFLPINCGAIPEQLLETQLFGHIRGAFTGATQSHDGVFSRARGGTLFLDEISELPMPLQVKLLRAIEEKEILPVGANKPRTVDVRIIAATNQDLEARCADGGFRQDLYYRLNVFGITIPPLRSRREDIPLLVDFLVHRHNVEMNRHVRGVNNAAMKLLSTLHWDGNIRELDNAIEHGFIVATGDWITTADLPARVVGAEELAVTGIDDNLKSAMHSYEGHHIAGILNQTGGDKREAAEKLGIGLSSLYRKIEELGIE